MVKVLTFIGCMLCVVFSAHAQKLYGGHFERQAAESLAGENFAYRFACTFYADEAATNALTPQLNFRIIRKRDNAVVREFMATKNADTPKVTIYNDCIAKNATLQVEHFMVTYSYEAIIRPTEFNDSQGYYVVNDPTNVARANTINTQSPTLVLYHWFSPEYLYERIDNADEGRAATGLKGAYAYICRNEGKSLDFGLSVSPLVRTYDPQALDLTARAAVPLTDGQWPFRATDWQPGFSAAAPNGGDLYVVDSKPKFDNNSETSAFSVWTVPTQNGQYNLAFVTELRRNGVKLAENSMEMYSEVSDCKKIGHVAVEVTEFGSTQASNTSFCSTKPIQLNAVTAEKGLSYQWYRDKDPILGATSAQLKVSATGTYFLKSKKDGACAESISATIHAVAINCSNVGPPKILGNNVYDMMNVTGPSKNGFLNDHSFRAVYYTPISDVSKMPASVRGAIYRKKDNQHIEDVILKRNSFADVTHQLLRLCDNGIDSVHQVTYDAAFEFSPDKYTDTQGYYFASEPVCCRADADNLGKKGTSVVTYLEVGQANQVPVHNSIQRGHTVELNIPFTYKTCVNSPVRISVYAGNRENITAKQAGFVELVEGVETGGGAGSAFRSSSWAPGYSADNFTGSKNKLIIEERKNGFLLITGIVDKPGIYVYRIKIDGTLNNKGVYSSVYQEFRIEVNDCSPVPKPLIFVSKVGKPTIKASTELCPDSLVQLNLRKHRSWGTFQWLLNNSPIANATDSVLIVPRNTSGQYTCTVRMPRQCPEYITTDPEKITFLTRPTALITANKNSFCRGDKLPLTAETDAQGSKLQWVLDNKDKPNEIQTIINATEPGNYVVRVTDTRGCMTNSLPYKVSINELPKVFVSSPQDYFCEAKNITLNATSVTGKTFQWLRENEPIGTNSSQLTITDTVKYTVKTTDVLGCVGTSIPINIRKVGNPTVKIIAPTNYFCQGLSLILTADVSTKTGRYEWFYENTLQNNTTTPNFEAKNAGNYSVRFTDASGCVGASTPIVVAMRDLPKATVSASKDYFCAGKTVILSTIIESGQSYQWLREGKVTGSADTPLTVLDTANYVIKITDSFGCSANSNPIKIRQINNPVVAINAPSNQFCEEQSLTLTAQSSSKIATYQWLLGNDLQTEGPNATFIAKSAGNYSVRVTDIEGCMGGSVAQKITVNPLPKSAITTTRNILCEGKSMMLTAATDNGNSYEWLSNGSNIGTKNTVEISQAGSYNVKTTSALGCSKISEAFVIQPVKNPAVSITSPTNRVCRNTPLTLSAIGTNLKEYQWLQDGKPLKNTDATFAVTETGQYSVRVVDNNQCESIAMPFAATIVEPVVVRLDSLPDFCGYAFEPIQLKGTPAGGTFSGKGVSVGQFAPREANVGLHIVTYSVRGDLECLNGYAQRSVIIKAAPALDLGPAREIYRGSGIKLNADMGAGYSYTWTPATWIDNPNSSKPRVDPDDNTVYTVRAVNENMCASEASVKIRVIQDIIAPSAFTPNGDGSNDTWVVRGVEQYPNVEVIIYNRWGIAIFYGKGPTQQAFDGTNNGEPLPSGTYTYIIKGTPNGNVKHGVVTLMR
jgi:gliding motility-associated-like protein